MFTRWFYIFFGCFSIPFLAFATHNRGGEITYVRISGNTYEFTITTCTDIGPQSQADRDELYIDYGDGSGDTLSRTQTIPQLFEHQKNVYVGTHTFSSTGTYEVFVEDPNRNGGILNFYPNGGGSSDNLVFALKSQLVISPFLGNRNTSVQFNECPCPEIACVGVEYCYNPLAVDPDGDSLSYELVAPLGSSGQPVGIPAVYVFPDQVGGGTTSLDPLTGTFCWTSPTMVGEFNFTIKITEWRNGIAVGYVMRDIQLTVQGNCTNTPPTITAPDEFCVTAGDNINFDVSVLDVDNDAVTLSASGLPLTLSSSPATFPTVSGNGSVIGAFDWNTNCDHIKPGYYAILFAVEDNGSPIMSNYTQTRIKIIPPQVTGISVQAFGNGVNVSWNASSCSNTEGYHVYRTTNPNFSFPNCCDDPNPTNHGFTKIGTVFGANNTFYYDATSLTLGIDYCYVITAFYNINQVESCPSDTACASLKKEVPIITHVTVNETDAITGIDSIRWAPPSELDTIQYPGPYHYKIYQGTSSNNINTFIGQTPSSNFLFQTDTIFISSGLNTVGGSYYFRVEIFYTNSGADSLVGSSNAAESIFVGTTPNDNQIKLTWDEDVPWINTDYEIYRSTSFTGPFAFIATTQQQTYTDTGLINGTDYCYYVQSIGYYSSPGIINPIENLSQIVCDQPIDLTPPCAPILSINGDCELGENELIWNNPNNSCADDVMSYNVYFTPIQGESMELIATISGASDTSFRHNFNGSVAGCYVVTAVDSVQYNNESDSSNIVCYDNCPDYWLPNVITPNGDGDNDLFHPLMPYRYVESIAIEIYNRWGQVVFATQDPDINWNGIHQEAGTPVSDGVYYYVCTVNTIRLIGIEPIQLNGFVHVIDNNGNTGK